MNKRLSRLGIAAAALIAAAYTVPASAEPIVTNWAFTIDSGFTASTSTAGTNPATGSLPNSYLTTSGDVLPLAGGGTVALPLAAADTKLSWGVSTGSGQSSFSVGSTLPDPGHFSGTVATGGGFVNTVTVDHNNQPITGASLLTATLFDVLHLTPLLPNPPYDGNPPYGPFPAPALTFHINFAETPNATPCDVASPTPCNDIFVLDVLGAGFNPVTKTLDQSFTYFGNNYFAQIALAGLDTLSDAACTAAGASSGCFGFTTIEGQNNQFQAALAITVPEPGSVALLGIGLTGLALSRRRKYLV